LLEETLVAGDWILIHVGFALSKIGEQEAHDQLQMLKAMGEDELAMEEVRGYSFAEHYASQPAPVPAPPTHGPGSPGPGAIGGHAAPISK
jgi:hydrogenase expression/formation protein HypC